MTSKMAAVFSAQSAKFSSTVKTVKVCFGWLSRVDYGGDARIPLSPGRS
jgi:hypothetical protein